MQLGFGCSLRGMNAAAVQVHIIFVKRVLYDLRHDMHTSRASVLADSKFCTIPWDWGVVWFGNHGSFCPPGLMRVVLQAVHQPGRASTSPPYMHVSLFLSLSVSSVYCKTQGCMYVRHIYTIYSQTFSSLRVLPFTLSEGPFYTKAWPIFKLSTVWTSAKEPCSKWDRSSSH